MITIWLLMLSAASLSVGMLFDLSNEVALIVGTAVTASLVFWLYPELSCRRTFISLCATAAALWWLQRLMKEHRALWCYPKQFALQKPCCEKVGVAAVGMATSWIFPMTLPKVAAIILLAIDFVVIAYIVLLKYESFGWHGRVLCEVLTLSVVGATVINDALCENAVYAMDLARTLNVYGQSVGLAVVSVAAVAMLFSPAREGERILAADHRVYRVVRRYRNGSIDVRSEDGMIGNTNWIVWRRIAPFPAFQQ